MNRVRVRVMNRVRVRVMIRVKVRVIWLLFIVLIIIFYRPYPGDYLTHWLSDPHPSKARSHQIEPLHYYKLMQVDLKNVMINVMINVYCFCVMHLNFYVMSIFTSHYQRYSASLQGRLVYYKLIQEYIWNQTKYFGHEAVNNIGIQAWI